MQCDLIVSGKTGDWSGGILIKRIINISAG